MAADDERDAVIRAMDPDDALSHAFYDEAVPVDPEPGVYVVNPVSDVAIAGPFPDNETAIEYLRIHFGGPPPVPLEFIPRGEPR